jgi:hypothetical protein
MNNRLLSTISLSLPRLSSFLHSSASGRQANTVGATDESLPGAGQGLGFAVIGQGIGDRPSGGGLFVGGRFCRFPAGRFLYLRLPRRATWVATSTPAWHAPVRPFRS